MEDVNEFCIFIDDLLSRASPMSECNIFKVPPELRQVNEKAYEPYFVSIGPYHHRRNDDLMAMEEHKVRFLKKFLERTENSSQRFVAAMRGMVKDARKCYAETSLMSDGQFLKMMALDGCFIVELLHLLCSDDACDHIFTVDLVVSRILSDLILFENQLPFFVLRKLLSMGSQNEESGFIKAFLGRFEHQLPGLKVDVVYDDESNPIGNVMHLLDLLHTNWRPPSDLVSNHENANKDPNWPRVHSVTELREAGVRFKKAEGSNLFDIKFSKGVLEIPKVEVYDFTECLFRNIIVREQFDNRFPEFLTDYIILMDRLIDSPRDVEKLIGKGIIINGLGNEEAVATMFNRLGDNVSFSNENFFYAGLSRAVNEHYEKPCNKSIAKLRHDYFQNPWALISFLAGVFLLILSFLQTAFTIFPRR